MIGNGRMTTGPARRQSPTEALLRSLLKARLVRTTRATLRNGWWHAKGRGLRNPPLPSKVRTIVFVCKGNICRSPYAALVASRALKEAGLAAVRCLSAGITAKQATGCPIEAVEVASSRGLSLHEHAPAPLSAAMVGESDMLVVMEAAQLSEIGARWPESRGKLWLLALVDPHPANAHERYNIPDPFGRPRLDFEACYDRIGRAVTGLVEEMEARAVH